MLILIMKVPFSKGAYWCNYPTDFTTYFWLDSQIMLNTAIIHLCILLNNSLLHINLFIHVSTHKCFTVSFFLFHSFYVENAL